MAILTCLIGTNRQANAQMNDTVIFSTLGSYSFTWTYSGYTPRIDRLGRPYVYLAAKELGLVTFSISDPIEPVPVDTISVAALGNLKATGVTQDKNNLFVSLGDFQGAGENAGLAIFDISVPASPVLLDRWDSAAFGNGTSSVVLEENYAFLSAMTQGVLIMDISDRQRIKFVTQIIPDPDFGSQHFVYHSRGLFISGDTLLVAHDNGGLRVIDVTDKLNPVEIGMYVNETIDEIGAAYYNHVYRIGNQAFCAVDFCGFESVDITDPAAMTSTAWLNPWNCTANPPPFGSWLGSDGHTNEIAYAVEQNVLFFSGGDSEILALDPRDPDDLRILGGWGQPNDNTGSWGVDVFGNLAAIANIHTAGFPFNSTVGGLQLLSWQHVLNVIETGKINAGLDLSPNPGYNQVTIHVNHFMENASFEMINHFGQPVKSFQNISGQSFLFKRDKLPAGLYFIRLSEMGKIIGNAKLIIAD